MKGIRRGAENPGNTSEVKRDIEGRRREAITGNLNNYSTHTKEKKNQHEKREKRKEKQGSDCALKRFCGGGVCLDVSLTSSVVYVERDFW